MRTTHPRPEFLASPAAQEFGDLAAAPVFVAATRAALLEFILAEPRGSTWEDASRSHHYTQGAKDFAEYLLTFIDPDPKKPQPPKTNLVWPTKQSLQEHRQPKGGKPPPP